MFFIIFFSYFLCCLQIWREYDTDNSGYIEADELKNFLRDLLKEAKKINDVSEDKLIEYTDTMVSKSIPLVFLYSKALNKNSFNTKIISLLREVDKEEKLK